MNRDDAILEIILGAIRRESDAFRYYSDGSKQSPYPETAALLRQLAEEERKHRQILIREFANLRRLLSADPEDADASFLKAEHIQYRLPGELPFQRVRSVPGIDLAAVSLPTQFIGGDYLESYPLHRPGEGSLLGLLLSDVMGHGWEATALKAEVRKVLGEITDEDNERLSRPDKLVSEINRSLYASCQRAGGFVTLCYVLLDPQRGEIRYVSAGHEPPVVVDSMENDERPLGGSQLLIGLEREQRYNQERAELKPGDMVVLFSDGILEALDPQQDENFGRERLLKSLMDGRSRDARGVVEESFKALRSFMKDRFLTDEATLAVAKLEEAGR